jgi:hypothetical protein
MSFLIIPTSTSCLRATRSDFGQEDVRAGEKADGAVRASRMRLTRDFDSHSNGRVLQM